MCSPLSAPTQPNSLVVKLLAYFTRLCTTFVSCILCFKRYAHTHFASKQLRTTSYREKPEGGRLVNGRPRLSKFNLKLKLKLRFHGSVYSGRDVGLLSPVEMSPVVY